MTDFDVPPVTSVTRQHLTEWPVLAAALLTPLLATLFYTVVHAYAAGRGAVGGDSDFNWYAFGVWVINLGAALPVAVLVSVAALGWPPRGRRGRAAHATAVSLLASAVVAVDFVLLGLATRSEKEGFPDSVDVTTALVFGALLTLVPAVVLWLWAMRRPASTADTAVGAGLGGAAWRVWALVAALLSMANALALFAVLFAHLWLVALRGIMGLAALCLMAVAAVLARRPQRWWLVAMVPLVAVAMLAQTLVV